MERRVPEPSEERRSGRFTATKVVLAVAALGVVLLVGVPRGGEGEHSPETDSKSAYGGKRNRLERELWDILRDPRFKSAPDSEEVVADIVALGPRAIPILFAILSGEFSEAFEEEGRARYDRPAETDGIVGSLQDQLLVEALVRLPREDVLDHLSEATAGEAPFERKLTAMRLLAQLPGEPSLELALRIAGGLDPIYLAHIRVQEPVQDALRGILEGAPESIRILYRDIDRLPDELLPLVARALPVGRHSEGVKVLFKLLDRDRTLDAIVLSRVSELAGKIHDEALDDSLWHIHWLMNNPDWNLRRESAVALGNLQDHTSCPQLVRMLGDQDRRVRQGALWALRNMSERRFDEDPEAWEAWYREETTWFETTAVRLEEQLESKDKALVIEAVAGLCQRPLYRHHAAMRLGPLVLGEDVQLVKAVCAALVQTRSRRAVPFLLAALDHAELQVAEAACRALRTLTGLDHPPERRAWERALEDA